MTNHYFHFTLGPVQGFVAQARRTRDFWAGSFLLSWLSAVAMQAVIKQGGEILFPKVSDTYLNWLEANGQSRPPQQGCVPNRFKGGLAKVPVDFNPDLVTGSIQQAWKALAELVWQQDLVGSPDITRQIWERQVGQFWEISWVLSDSEAENNLLDRRKNWRTHLPPVESGVKCMMMDGWQELSGISTPNAIGLKQFWDSLRKTGRHGMASDLRDSEYLCAIAFIKRRFARYFEQLKAEMPGGWALYGWNVNVAVPSVAYIAVAPWLAKVLELAPVEQIADFHDKASHLTEQAYDEHKTNLKCIKSIIDKQKDKLLFWKLKSLDGNVFFETALDNKNLYEDQTQAQNVKRALKALRHSVSDALEPASPFYAVLMMDGDSLGKHMSELNKQQTISRGLEQFTERVPKIVEKHSGFLVYAGGDDVLALLPLEYALDCANDLRKHYLYCFKQQHTDITTTLSGAIEYAHIRMPLGKVLADAHQLLDEIAKDQTGRDAIAVRVWKPGGQHLEWAMPWTKAIDESGKVVIQQLAEDFQKDNQETPFSNSFFFHVEQRFALLNEGDSQLFTKQDMIDLIAADYLNSGINQTGSQGHTISLEQARQRISPLLEQCFPVKRQLHEGKGSAKLNTDALQLVRFLAQKGVDHG